jgi:hypothetical protein
MKLLGMVKTKMNEDDCNWEESYIMLNRIEEKINN